MNNRKSKSSSSLGALFWLCLPYIGYAFDALPIKDSKWVVNAAPSNSDIWMKTLSSTIETPLPSYDHDSEAVVLMAGLWEEIQGPMVSEVENHFGIRLPRQMETQGNWTDILRFIESGQSEAVYRFLERRKPSQEINVAADSCLRSDDCAPEIHTTVWFSSKEHRGSSFRLGSAANYRSDETGTHQVVTNLVHEGDMFAMLQSTFNPTNNQRHEHIRIAFPGTSSLPPTMLYRWYVSKNNQAMAMVKWYRRSLMPYAPGRRNNPLPNKFTTDTYALRRIFHSDLPEVNPATPVRSPTRPRPPLPHRPLGVSSSEAPTIPPSTTTTTTTTTTITITTATITSNNNNNTITTTTTPTTTFPTPGIEHLLDDSVINYLPSLPPVIELVGDVGGTEQPEEFQTGQEFTIDPNHETVTSHGHSHHHGHHGILSGYGRPLRRPGRVDSLLGKLGRRGTDNRRYRVWERLDRLYEN